MIALLTEALRGLRVYARDKLRLAVAIGVLAIGVGLGLAIDLVNGAALSEFSSALAALSGDADLTIRGPRSGFSEAVLGSVARAPEVAAASPVVQFDAVDLQGRPLTVIGIDPFRAAFVERDLVAPVPEGDRLALLKPDSIFLGPAAMQRLGLSVGQIVQLRGPGSSFAARVAGAMPASEPRVADVAVMDIAPAQLYGDSVGRISRIDLRARPGVSREALRRALDAVLPPGLVAQSPRAAAASDLRISRAYRVNLLVLAMVALFCGSLLIFSSQVLQVARRRQEFALLRALGMTRGGLLRRLVVEAVLLGVPGAALGVLIGYALAGVALHRFGGDLGAGFFRGVSPKLNVDGWATAAYFLAGVTAAVAGAWLPAIEAARMNPARGLKSGSIEDAYRAVTRPWPGSALILCGAFAMFLPPLDELPIGGYLAIALMLVGAVGVVPTVLAAAMRLVPAGGNPVMVMAAAQLRNAPSAPAISLAAIVAAVSLAVAMMIMVHSFRVSFQEWLGRILPADAYVSGGGLRLSPADQARIGSLPVVARAEFMRLDDVRLEANRPPVAILARDIDPRHPERRLPLVVAGSAPDALPPAWVSESAAALYGFAVGDRIDLRLAARRTEVRVAGIFRDYGRQQGAIVIERSLYRQVTGDPAATAAALWLRAGSGAGDLRRELAWLGPQAEVKDTSEIRSLSLSIFDRTFAITYALVAVAVLIGLAALGANLGALILARRHEFAVLRHLGLRRRDIARLLLAQSSMIAATGLAMGSAVGYVVGGILIYVVNRQSFNWTMGFHVPAGQIAALAGCLMGLALLVTAVSARGALTGAVVRAVAEDW